MPSDLLRLFSRLICKKYLFPVLMVSFVSVAYAATPTIPSLNVPSSDSDGTYSVSWGAVSGATSYELIGELSGTLYKGSGRSVVRTKPNGIYYYRIRACNSSGCSAYSAKKGITVNIPPIPSVPSLNVPSSDSDGTYSVSWGAVSGATSYELIGELSGTLYKGSGRSVVRTKPNGIYYYRIRACNSSGCSAYSAKKGITVNIPPIPSVPSLNVPSSDSDGTYSVSWGAVSGATSYELVGELSGTLYKGSGRTVVRTKPNGTYYYKVRACNSSGCSAYSAKKGITVNIPKPELSVYWTPNEISEGASATFYWSATNATKCYNSYGEERATSGSSSILFTSAQTKVASWTCDGPGGSGSASATLEVHPKPSLSLNWSPNTIVAGESSTLSWSTTGATSCNNGTQQPINGSSTVQFNSEQTYTASWRCDGPGGGSVEKTATVNVLPAPPTLTIKWNKAKIIAGNSGVFEWSSTNADKCYNTYGDEKATSGTSSVLFANPQTYTATWRCTGSGGEVTKKATIQVVNVSVNTFEWSPATIKEGEATTFNWNISNVERCYSVSEGANNDIQRQASGSIGPYVYDKAEVHETKWYCIDISGNRYPANNDEYITATRTVLPPPTLNIKWRKDKIISGNSVIFEWSSSNADKCYNTYGDERPTSGTTSVLFSEPQTYTATWRCTGKGGEVTEKAVIQVVEVDVTTFDWDPSPIKSGGSTTFKWNISNVDRCYSVSEGANNDIQRQAFGSVGPYVYTEPEVHETKWYCIDISGNRYPSNDNEFITATRIVSNTSSSKVLFIHTDLLGTSVAETDVDGEMQ
ncbi:hypothetical protein tinsulaeT_20810 [Thalassotalea insulae]|uniref:Fibronectin type-III domain-containing protein n=1 Tax=Thalassotalea insulae TaxID=2056778 RepID=A0ABQ6GX49_9GAMM|nr:hypothetical protein [Thalassotalea insulae]GLX78741.1 hypothetical protein tinsulaeT_20810 [Thalassotalea insulae]